MQAAKITKNGATGVAQKLDEILHKGGQNGKKN